MPLTVLESPMCPQGEARLLKENPEESSKLPKVFGTSTEELAIDGPSFLLAMGFFFLLLVCFCFFISLVV